jgi:hypothetical protein
VDASTKRILGIHFGLFLAEAICVSAFVLELHRALSGNTLSWAYVFEWPIFAVYALYLWRKLLNDERRGPRPSSPATPEESDDKLADYNDYLRRIHDEKGRGGGNS